MFFDTETTGIHRGARLVELAAIRYENGKEVGRLVSLVDPGVRIPAEARAVHGISDAMVRGKPRAAEILRQFHEFIDSAVLIAHYAVFDLRIINYELAVARLPALKNAHVCTRNLSRRHLPALYDHKLTTVARHLKLLTGAQEHRALGDALLVAGVYHKLMGIGIPATSSSSSTATATKKVSRRGTTNEDAEYRRARLAAQSPNQIAKGVFLCECGYKLVFDPDHLREDKRRSKDVPIALPDRPRSKHSIFLWRGSVLHVSCHLDEERRPEGGS